MRDYDFAPEGVPFRFNFLHDLEPLFWMLLWYFHNNIPTAFKCSRAKAEHINKLKESCLMLFACEDIHGTPGRSRLISLRRVTNLCQRMEQWEWYETVQPLLACIAEVGLCLGDAYRALEEQIPKEVVDGVRRWSIDQFTDVPYVQIQECVERALKELSEGLHKAVSTEVLSKRPRDESSPSDQPNAKRA